MSGSPNYRTGSGSDLAVWVPFNPKRANHVALFAKGQDQFELKSSFSLAQRPGPMRGLLNYRTGSGSDLAVTVPLNQSFGSITRLKLNLKLKRSLSRSQRPGRYRFLFCS
jgi:hypothetical protein